MDDGIDGLVIDVRHASPKIIRAASGHRILRCFCQDVSIADLGENHRATRISHSSRTQAVIVCLQYLDDLSAAELFRYLLPPREHFAQTGARDGEAVLGAVGTGSTGRHALALVAVERHVDFQRLDRDAALRNLVENMLRVERTVIVSEPSGITAEHEDRAAEILPQHRMQQRFARAGIAHFNGIAGLYDRAWDEIVFDKSIDGFRSYFGWNIAGL